MSNEEVEKMLLDNDLEGIKFLTDYNYGEAIVGYTLNEEPARLVYDYGLMV